MESENDHIEEQSSSHEQPSSIFQHSAEIEMLTEAITAIRKQLSTYIVGQRKMVDLILTAILADGHVLLEGVPGVAKTLTAKLIAKSVDTSFSRVQFTPDLMPSDVTGTTIFNVKSSEFEFKKGPIFANIVLIDEINRSPAKTQAALFEAMEESQVTADGTKYLFESPFIVLATQNPIEQEGTYRLPEAQLDRFMFKIEVEYPTAEEEAQILMQMHAKMNEYKDLSEIEPVISATKINQLKQVVQELHIEKGLVKYIAEIVSKTRNHPSLYLGASPRASIALMQGAKAYAGIQGRSFVTPEDIKELAYPVLRHRLLLTPEKELEGITLKETIDSIIEGTEIPR